MIARIAAVNGRRWIVNAKIAVAFVFFCSATFGADSISTFAAAEKIWKESKGRPEYQSYAAEFAQFNNHFHLDTKNGCYASGSQPIQLMLVIVHHDREQFGKIEQVFSDAGSSQAECFKKTYTGIATKAPPFYPFVLQMGMN